MASARRGAGGCAGGRRRASARGRRHRDPSRPIRGCRPWSPAPRDRACRASRDRRSAGPSPSSRRRRRPVRARTRSAVGVSQKRPASIALAASTRSVLPSRSNGTSRNLPRRVAEPSVAPCKRLELVRRGAHEDRRRGRGLEDGAPGHPSLELLGHDREIGQLRHAGGSSLARMVCSRGRVADNPISARERVVPIG